MARKIIDWEAIEREFTLGQKSVRALADQFGISHTAINKRAKKYSWVQDKTKEIQTKTKASLASFHSEVSKQVSTPTPQDINKAVETNVTIILSHRKDITKLRELEVALIKELKENPTKLYITQYRGEIISREVALTASERAAAANNIASVQQRRIQLERQAFNLSDDGDANISDDLKEILSNIAGATRGLPNRSQGKIRE